MTSTSTLSMKQKIIMLILKKTRTFNLLSMRSYYMTTEDLINVVGFEWDENGKKIHASELAWQQYMQFNPFAAWFKGRRLSIRNDLVNLFKDWGSA
ncbi:hypothetical protein Taro_027176 [Colocasia esculenta]|uniref:Myb/SANT-like domain-containing protein n=1 Tax=Colocasia esculenta TaxID=4460 RepID=A0A843VMW5_COLES|nr:hypothetical protein [Colocasia esculenta]